MRKQRILSMGWAILAFGCLTNPVLAESDAASNTRRASQVEHWYQQAEEGNANALFNLGQYFRKGIGVDRDLDQARQFYQRAAELGHPEAQLNLGTLHFFAGDAPDYDQSRYWWLKAARQGSVDAQYQLAILYLKQPDPVPLDALAWMTLAARSGDAQAVKAEAVLSQQLAIDGAQLQRRIRGLNAASAESVPINAAAESVDKPTEPSRSTPDSAAPVPAVAQAPTQVKVPAAESRPAPEQASVRAVKPVTQAPPPSSNSRQNLEGGFAVQLASLSRDADAQALAVSLAREHAAVLENHPVIAQELRGAYKVMVAGFADRGSAGNVCKQLKTRKQPCFVVKR